MSMVLAFILWLFIGEYAKSSGVDANYFFIMTAIIFCGGLSGLGHD